jgi:hypothetical protein
LQGRLTPEAGAALLRALDAAAQKLYDVSAPGSPRPRDAAGETTADQRRADALGLEAESALAGGLDPGTRGDRYQVVLHVDASAVCTRQSAVDDATHGSAETPALPHVSAEMLASESQGTNAARVSAETFVARACEVTDAVGTENVSAETSTLGTGCELDTTRVSAETSTLGACSTLDGRHVSAETCRRIACDCALVSMTHEPDGNVLDVGRRTRTISPALRRALEHRDGGCRFPGCGLGLCDAHHVEHWADGGATKLSNLLQLCRFHHRAVHEGGFRVVLSGDGGIRFFRPDGRPLEQAPALPLPTAVLGTGIQPGSSLAPHVASAVAPTWDGRPIDNNWSIEWLRSLAERAAQTEVTGDQLEDPSTPFRAN